MLYELCEYAQTNSMLTVSYITQDFVKNKPFLKRAEKTSHMQYKQHVTLTQWF